jgi:hypothetical protein
MRAFAALIFLYSYYESPSIKIEKQMLRRSKFIIH